ncbi:MAG: hypothetical protein BMS9Abin13_103 [Patescibacteria group bacterium]|nr:MAG: hypothetical protein BMS9Abin13_103 [Patescibacteria group bacterium]
MFIGQNKKKGFTLLELLIVISIIAILAVIVILVLNPGETLKKARDVQRMSDMATMKTAIALILTSSTTPYLSSGNYDCLTTGTSTAKIWYSSEVASPTCTADLPEGADADGTYATTGAGWCSAGGTSGASDTDGTGWIPIKLSWLPGGSPLSNLPLDPINDIIDSIPSSTDKVYRYTCQTTAGSGKPSTVFEINTILESEAFTVTDNKMTKDGGDNDNYYEVGTNLKLLPTDTQF